MPHVSPKIMSIHKQQDSFESEPLLISPSPSPEPWIGRKPTPSTNILLLFAGAIILSIFAGVSLFAIRYPDNGVYTGIHFTSPEIQSSWGAYTPYFPVKPYIPPPSHCQITQVGLKYCFLTVSQTFLLRQNRLIL